MKDGNLNGLGLLIIVICYGILVYAVLYNINRRPPTRRTPMACECECEPCVTVGPHNEPCPSHEPCIELHCKSNKQEHNYGSPECDWRLGLDGELLANVG